MRKHIIQKVWKNKGAKQKLVTIPAKSDINEGDYVHIRKVSVYNFKLLDQLKKEENK